MMTIYRKNILIIFILVTILIPLILFAVSIFVEAATLDSPEENNGESTNLESNFTHNQILYSLEIVELTEKNLSKTKLERLAYLESSFGSDFNLIQREELTEIYGEEFESMLEIQTGEESSDTIFIPQIVVVPFHIGVLRVAQEELLLDVESVDSIVYTNVFELKVEPRGAYNRDRKAVFTALDLQTGEGPTGLETEVWIEKEKPYLLGIMERYREKVEKDILGGGVETRKRYFALYLSARPAGILTLPDLSSSLYGLNKLLDEPKIAFKENNVNLRLAYLNNVSSDYGLTLKGFIRQNDRTALTINIEDTLVKRHSLGIMGRSFDNMWLGAEVIALENDDYKIALSLIDTVNFNGLKFTAGINPLAYNFEDSTDSTTWFFKSEAQLTKSLNLGLEYRGLEESDIAECSLGYQFSDSYGVESGYSWNVDQEEEDSIWLGMNFNF